MKAFSKTLQVVALVGLMLGMLALGPATLLAKPLNIGEGSSPIKGGGNFGIGLELGGPGDWGAVGKIWMDTVNAFQPAVKLGGGTAILQLDYLWHNYDVIHVTQGLMPLYFGVGGNLALQNSVIIGARGVVGISYLFNRTNVPVDIYIQVVPEIWFGSGASAFNLYGDIGSRYYF